MAATEHWIDTPDGDRLFAQVAGSGTTTIICCNGIGVSTFFWKYLVGHFADRARVVLWDYRGHGRSPHPADLKSLTIAQMADDAVHVLDHLGVDRAMAVGHSMGCQVILETWRRHPDRVSGLVPVLGTYGRPVQTFLGLNLEPVLPLILPLAQRHAGIVTAVNRLLLRPPLAFHFARYTGLISHCLASAEDMAAYFAHLGKLDMRIFLALLEDMAVHTTEDILDKIDVPTLIIGGERDLFTPAWLSHSMQERIRDAELLMVPGGSHAALVEQPQLLNLAIHDFMDRRGVWAKPASLAVNGAAVKKAAPARKPRRAPAKAAAATKPGAKTAPRRRSP